MRTLLFLLALALAARAQMHPSLPEPGTLDGLAVNIHFTEPQPGELETICAAGFRWVRMDFRWAATEPEAKYLPRMFLTNVSNDIPLRRRESARFSAMSVEAFPV